MVAEEALKRTLWAAVPFSDVMILRFIYPIQSFLLSAL
jgi:hypothetical protein